MSIKENVKFELQDAQYTFPYHYLPSLEKGSVFRLHRKLARGLDYMTYMSFVEEIIYKYEPESLLDIGCGDGRLIHMIKNFVPKITGIDLSYRAVAFARAFNPDVEIICGDIADLSNHQYALVTLIEVLEHIPDNQIKGFVKNIARLVKTDGHLLITVPTINLPIIRKHYRHYNLEMLENTLKPFFYTERYWWLYRRGLVERFMRFVLYNKFYVLNFSPLLKMIWNIHKHVTYFADAGTGAHLVYLARPKFSF